jgi:hypothetical protein
MSNRCCLAATIAKTAAQASVKAANAAPRQRSAASRYGVCSQFGPRGRDTYSARLPRRPSSIASRPSNSSDTARFDISEPSEKSPAFTQERPVWFPKNASRRPKESRTKSSLSLVTLNRGPMGSGCCKSAAPKCMRSGYEKMRPVSQKARVRCPLP